MIWWEVVLRGDAVSLRLCASEQGEWTIGIFGAGILGSATIARGAVETIDAAQHAAEERAGEILLGLAGQLKQVVRASVEHALSTLTDEREPTPGWEDRVLAEVDAEEDRLRKERS